MVTGYSELTGLVSDHFLKFTEAFVRRALLNCFLSVKYLLSDQRRCRCKATPSLRPLKSVSNAVIVKNSLGVGLYWTDKVRITIIAFNKGYSELTA